MKAEGPSVALPELVRSTESATFPDQNANMLMACSNERLSPGLYGKVRNHPNTELPYRNQQACFRETPKNIHIYLGLKYSELPLVLVLLTTPTETSI